MNRISTCLVVFFLTIITGLSAQSVSTEAEYLEFIGKERLEKDKAFAESNDSPLDPKYKPEFKGLNYFKADFKWYITARIEKFSDPDTIRMKTTTERLPLYLVYGKAYFILEEKEFSLTIYRNIGLMTKPGFEDYLFVPYRDETSGNESYGGGRYMDARIINGDKIVLDFNRAYNPYCVYNKKYSCPVPPSENYLSIPVNAGEKDFGH
ncbi:MAG: DUF1684 domain-containing protein [Lentimicrobium sp.]|nr:DUF1684 domain-containing protein [Lentimicrobium sp.]